MTKYEFVQDFTIFGKEFKTGDIVSPEDTPEVLIDYLQGNGVIMKLLDKSKTTIRWDWKWYGENSVLQLEIGNLPEGMGGLEIAMAVKELVNKMSEK